MSQALTRAEENSSGFRRYLLVGYYLMASNVSLSTIAAGVLMMLTGWLVVENVHNVFAGMFGIWGFSLVILGTVAYAALWANRIIARVTD